MQKSAIREAIGAIPNFRFWISKRMGSVSLPVRCLPGLLLVLILIAPARCLADEPGTVTVPLQVLETGHIAVQVKVNGKGPFRLILDTGAPVTLLGARAALQVGLVTPEQVRQPNMMGLLGMGTIKTLQVGKLEASNVDVIIMEHPIVALVAQVVGPLDGILGFTFFSHYRTTLNYAEGTVSFTPVSYRPVDVFASMLGRLMSDENSKRVIAPAALWGLVVEKPDREDGVRIAKVYKGSAAETAGLQVGDRLLTLDGRWTDTVNDCYEAAVFVRPGQTARVKVLRAGNALDLSVVPRAGL